MKLSLVSLLKLIKALYLIMLISISISACSKSEERAGIIDEFNRYWKFNLDEIPGGHKITIDDSGWRAFDLPHDWSIEGTFRSNHSAIAGGGALPGGIGCYQKSFHTPVSQKGKLVFIEFDGIYHNSEAWINEQYLGQRLYGYSSFSYELSPYLKYGDEPNIIAVKVDNSEQPNSRWYSGSGIYRKTTAPIHIKQQQKDWRTLRLKFKQNSV